MNRYNETAIDDDLLLQRGADAQRPSIENLVAFQWNAEPDSLAYRKATRRDRVVLDWLAGAITTRPAAALDVGCAYGTHLLMLNARLNCDPLVRLVGVDLYDGALAYGRDFAARVNGYENVRFEVADIENGLPFEDDAFSAVNLADVLEHLENPVAALDELRRVTRPGGTIVVSTPLRDSLFKQLARSLNGVAKGRLYKAYYAGKSADLNDQGNPVMVTHAGHDHISEMTLPELRDVVTRARLEVHDMHLMPIMNGSAWFDRHPFILSAITLVEAIHEIAQRPSWAHAVCLRLVVPAT